MGVADRLRQALIAVNAEGNRRGFVSDVRKLVVRAAVSTRKPGGLLEAIGQIARLDAIKQEETATWVSPEAVTVQGGRFDACDLRHWLEIARLAGVPSIPAEPILILEEYEIALLGGKVRLPDNPATRAIRRETGNLAKEFGADRCSHSPNNPDVLANLEERCFAAMDGVPDGWMVRHARCGPSTLKTLAGCGVAGGHVPEVAFGPDLVVGPGWVRNGNRRRVDVTDGRTMQVGIGQGPDAPHTWLARPWVPAARWTECEDPHRHGSAVAGPGCWPAEWRVFVERGEVTGVSYYYPWAGEATQQNAAHALMVRDVAQHIVDVGIAVGAVPAFLDIEFAREHPQFAEMGFAARFPRDGFACCLDFIEVAREDGDVDFMLLEGGPALCLFGGAHPCGFVPVIKRTHRADGIVLRLPDGVNMMDQNTWDVPIGGAIFTWEEAERLAADIPGLPVP